MIHNALLSLAVPGGRALVANRAVDGAWRETPVACSDPEGQAPRQGEQTVVLEVAGRQHVGGVERGREAIVQVDVHAGTEAELLARSRVVNITTGISATLGSAFSSRQT